MPIPKFDDLFNPLLNALRELGGSSSIAEMEEKVAENLRLTEEETTKIHSGNRTEFSYRLAWARTYLKKYGILENSSRGVWALTPKGMTVKQLDKKEVTQYTRELGYESEGIEEEINEGKTPEEASITWQEELLGQLLKMSSSSFEVLCQRMLRESGFIEVKVTGRSGDGGIDGRGIIKIGGLIGFRVVFQCKRWRGNVSSKEIRDFRGAMDGRADKGLLITTGNFTRDARDEASRDGAFPIDLMDGEELVAKLKELELGVNIVMKEKVEIDKNYFSKIN